MFPKACNITPPPPTSAACLPAVVRHPETKSLVKPDIVFFGEAVPDRVFDCAAQDLPACDLLLVIAHGAPHRGMRVLWLSNFKCFSIVPNE